ncbi:MAG: hypothetical protein BIFFINMI_00596 [Phycisphaerae bacterium]|nr:hypothetical protein [Phycisphaerae bacterium]
MARAEPLFRQWNLLKTLQAFHFGQTEDDLAKRLECCKRTVQRDLNVLQQIGFPVFHETGEYGKRFWRLEAKALDHDGLTLSMTEMLSLYLSQQLLAPLAGTQFGDGLNTALEKIKALLPKSALGHFFDDRTLLVKNLPGQDYSGKDKEIAIINKAMAEGRVLKVRYHSLSKGKDFDATFHPYGLVFLGTNLYCIGLLVEYGEVRTLKVSRIVGVQMTAQVFERPSNFSLRAYTHGSFGIFTSSKFQTIRARFTGWAATSLREQRWHTSQKIVKDTKDGVVAEFELSDTTEFRRWILGFGGQATIISPKSLAAAIQSELKATCGAYGINCPHTPAKLAD